MVRPHFRVIAIVLILLAGTLFAQSEVARKIIHEDQYRPTPGDVYTLTINYGISPSAGTAQRTESISLILQADYQINVPYIGMIDASTLSYNELQNEVTTRVRERLLAPFATLTLAAPAVFDVFIWGSVETPGYHTVTSLNRLLDTIAAAGGTQPTGSRRQIEVQSGNTSQRYDLVAFLSQGDQRQNPYLQPGSRIFVPVADSAVELQGAVVKPGTYELIGDETVGDVIELAGGLLPTAQIDKATVNRLDEQNRYTVVDLASVDIQSMPARTGDVITIPASTSTSETVLLEGAIHRGPAEEGNPRAVPLEPLLLEVPYTPGMTVLRVLERFGGPTNFAELERSFIIRGQDNLREPIPDLGTLWTERQWDRDIALRPGDRLVVPMKRLVVSVGGSVNSAGAFAFTSGYTVGDYLELAGGVDEENGSPNRLFFAEPDGSLTRVDVSTPVPIGTNIYVGRSGWGRTKQAFSDLFTVTGWITGIIGVATVVIEFVQLVSP
ncbi:MAG: SLBB domain-containing protein [Spirochaetota bacterium]